MFLKKIFGNKESTQELSNIEKIFYYNKQAREIIKGLENKRLPERVYKPVATAFPLYIKGISEGLEEMVKFKPRNEDGEELEKFYKNVLKSLKTIHSFQANQGKLVAVAFEEEVLRLGGIFNKIIEIQQEIGKEIEKRKIDRYKNEKIKYYTDKHKKIEQKINEKNKEIQILKDEIKKLEKELNSINFDATAQKKIEEELSVLELRILVVVGKTTKKLKRYLITSEDKEKKKIAEKYIRNPLKTFFEDKELEIVKLASLEEKKDYLTDLRSKYENLKKKDEEIKKKSNEIVNLEEKIRINRIKLEKLEKEKEKLQESLHMVKKKREMLLSALEVKK